MIINLNEKSRSFNRLRLKSIAGNQATDALNAESLKLHESPFNPYISRCRFTTMKRGMSSLFPPRRSRTPSLYR